MTDYTKTGKPLQGSRGISKEVRDEFAMIESAVNSKANIASPTFTGTPAAPTATLGDSSTQLATTAFVAGTAFSSALPAQLGNADRFLTTDGTNASWSFSENIVRNTQSGAYTALAGDRGKLIDWTGGVAATLALTAAATLGDGWYCYVQNAGTATLTINPDGAETIDGAATIQLIPDEAYILQCNGTNFLTVPVRTQENIRQSDRTSNTQLLKADRGKLINITSGTFSQTFEAAATLGDGWWCYIHNNGTGDITLDPNSTETIDGLTTYIMYPGEIRKVICDGSALRSIVLNAFSRTFTSSGTFTTPPGYKAFSGLLWGGGGSGARSTTAGSNASGAGGGACNPFTIDSNLFGASQTITIGAGGAAQSTANTDGNAGGSSTIGSLLTAFGGGPGVQGVAGVSGGGGGGLTAAPVAPAGGEPSSEMASSSVAGRRVFGGGNGDGSGAKSSTYGGGGGDNATDAGPVNSAGSSIYGGGGGGAAVDDTGTASAGGTSKFGGAGGAGGLDANGTAGTQPGGGGGGTHNGAQSGAGGDGQLTIWGVI